MTLFHRILCVTKFIRIEPSIALLVMMYCSCSRTEMKLTEKQELLACTDDYSAIYSVTLAHITYAMYYT